MTQPAALPSIDIRRILLPIEGTDIERAAVDYAALLAASLHASITLVHVDEIANAMVGLVPGASVEGDLAASHRIAVERLTAVALTLANRGIVGTAVRCFAAPAVASALVALARVEGFDLIIMATHARAGVSRVLLGSVTEDVLRTASCPVLAVHLP